MTAFSLTRLTKGLLFLGLMLFSLPAVANPPAEILVSGALAAPDGAPLQGPRAWQITFFDADEGGIALGVAQGGTVDVSDDGLFNIAIIPPAAVLSASEAWYELAIDTDDPVDGNAGDDVFTDRIRLFSVPFAIQAEEVVNVDVDQIGSGVVGDAEFEALDGVSSNIQQQIDAIDTSGIAANAAAIQDNSDAIALNTAAIATKADASSVYTQGQIDAQQGAQDTAISLKANSADVYTQAQIDAQQGSQDTEIATKANAADVYGTSAADTAFVDAAGDTMSGGLAISDTTASTDKDSGSLVVEGGVGIEGDLNIGGSIAASGGLDLAGSNMVLGAPGAAFSIQRPAADIGQAGASLRIEGQDGDVGQDGGSIILEPGAGVGASPGGIIISDGFGTPSITIDTLYNSGGNLFWNGVQLDASNIGKSAISNSGLLSFDWVDSEIANALTIQGGSVNNDSFSAFSDLGAESKIGSAADQVAAGDHGHNLQDLSGAVTDAQVPDALTIQGGTVNNDSFSAYSDLGAEGTLDNNADADLLTRLQADGRFSFLGHSHNLQDLGGAVTNAQVPDALTIQGGTVNNDSFSAYSDLGAESKIGSAADQVAAGDHGHSLGSLSGSVSDAQVANNITIQGGSVNNDSFSAVSDLTAEGLLDNNAGGDLLTRDQLDARFEPVGGGGGSAEIWDTFSGPGTLTEFVLGSAVIGANIKHNDAAASRVAYFANHPVNKTVTGIVLFVNRYEAWAGARTLTVEFHIRDIASGAVAHTVTTAPFNITTAANVSWHTLTLDANVANRTITTSEYLGANLVLSGADGGTGELEVRFIVTVE